MFGLGVNRLGVTNQATIFTPASLFNNGEAGVWYDPSAASGSLDWQRNLLEYTEQFDNGYWSKGADIITPNAATAPDGTQTADKFVAANNNSTHEFNFGNSFGTSVFVQSIYAKAGEYSFLFINGVGNSDFTWFNLSNGTVGTVSSLHSNVTMTPAGDGWYRCSVTVTGSNAGAGFGASAVNGLYAYQGNGTSGVYMWGAQLEEASTASNYQPILSTFDNAFKAAFPSHTLYQDYQGVTPVTAVGQPVGLMLDKSEGLAQGAEEITNGDFSNGLTGWVTAGDVSIVSGSAHITNTSTYGAQAFQGVSGLTVGKFYKLTLDTEAISGDSSWYIDDFLGVYVQGVTSGQGRHFYILQATATSFTLQFKKFGAGVVSVDNVSVKEIQGSHATQPTSTKRPIYARHPEGGIRNLFNYTEQFDNGYWSKATSDSTAVPVVTANQATAPDGTQTADLVNLTAPADNEWALVRKTNLVTVNSAPEIQQSVWVKAYSSSQAGKKLNAYIYDISANAYKTVGVIVLTTEWQRFIVSHVFPAGAQNIEVSFGKARNTAGGITQAETATQFYLWGAQLEEATEASNYQKVVTDIDVTESGVGEVYYLKFDGVDDGMAINNLTSASTPLTALFGYSATNANANSKKYLIDIVSGRTVFAASADFAGQIGYFDDDWSFFTADSNAIKVLTYDLVEDNAKMRVDGTQEYSDTTYNQQAIGGNVGLFTKHNRVSNFLAGNMYQTILRAAESTDEEIAKAETFVANKTGLKAQVDGIATLDLNFGNNTYTAKNSNGGVI